MFLTSIPRSALVVGASGGIGLAVTEQLLEQGHRLFVTTRDVTSAGAQALKKLHEHYPGKLTLLEMDMTRDQSIEAACQAIKKQCPHLHLVFNCSGLLHEGNLQPEKRLEDLDGANLQRSFQVNSIGPLLLARFVLPLLRHDEPSVLANLSARVGSISDNRIGGWYGYRASKAAQNMATRTMAIELGRRSKNTIVVGLHPGTVDTRLSAPFQASVKPGQLKTPAESATHLLNVIDALKPEDSGKVFAWDGSVIPY